MTTLSPWDHQIKRNSHCEISYCDKSHDVSKNILRELCRCEMYPTSEATAALSLRKRILMWNVSTRRKHSTIDFRCDKIAALWLASVAWALTLCSHSDKSRRVCLRVNRSQSMSRGITCSDKLVNVGYVWLKHTAFANVVRKVLVGTLVTAKYGCDYRVLVRCGVHIESDDFCQNIRVVCTVTRGQALLVFTARTVVVRFGP